MRTIILKVISKPATWIALGAFLLGSYTGWSLKKPEVKTIVKVEERVVTRWKMADHVETRPGSTTYMAADGSTVIYGPATIARKGEGTTDTERKTDSKTESIVPWHIMAGLGGGLNTSLEPEWEAMAGARVGSVLFFDVGLAATARGRGGFDAGGVMLLLAF